MFHFFTSNLILKGLCRNQDIVDTFNVSTDSVRRWKRILNEKEDSEFFTAESRHGLSHKLFPDVFESIQIKLNKCHSVISITKEEGLSGKGVFNLL